MNDKMDFNFGAGGGIFGDFEPDLTSLQATKEEEKQEDLEEKTVEEVEDTTVEDQEDQNNELEDTEDVQNEELEDVANVSYKAITDYLAESGIIDSLEDYEGDDTPEALEMAIQNTISNMVQHYKDSIPETGKQFLNYLEKGGDPTKFYQSLEQPLDFKNLDLTDESIQKQVYREYLKSLDYTEEEITEELNDAEDNLLLEKKAKTASSKLEKIYSKKQQELLEQQELQQQEQVQKYQNYVNEINKTIEGSTDLAGLTLSPSEKIEFKKYLLDVDNEGLTKYQKELNDNPVKTQLELAYLKFKKYDFSKVTKQATTQATRHIKNIIKQTDKTNARSNQQVTRSTSGDLSAFKTQLF